MLKLYSAHGISPQSNALATAADALFSLLGQIQTVPHFTRPKLQKKVVKLLNHFKQSIAQLNYSSECLLICHYIICLVFDDVIQHTAWGRQEEWSQHTLLKIYYQDIQGDKFFIIMQRMIKEPHVYIDTIELMYLCLRLGYQGEYRDQQQGLLKLNHISDYLYKLIRAYRGRPYKKLSPKPLHPLRQDADYHQPSFSALFIFFVTTSIIMTIFLSLGYLADNITNETYNNITKIQKSVSFNTKI